eukprot:s2513_g6.t2
MGSPISRAAPCCIVVGTKLLAYLQHTQEYALMICPVDQDVTTYTDSSYAPEGGRSHSGVVVTWMGAPLSWRATRTPYVCLSTAASELTAAIEGLKMTMSLGAVLQEITRTDPLIHLAIDNQSTIAIAKPNGSTSWRTRHLRVRSAFIREQIENKKVIVKYVKGQHQLADLLTKSFPRQRLEELVTLWGMGRICKGAKATMLKAMIWCTMIQSVRASEPLALDTSSIEMYAVILVLGIAVVGLWEFAWLCVDRCCTRPEETRSARRMRRLRETIQRELDSQIGSLDSETNQQPPVPPPPVRRVRLGATSVVFIFDVTKKAGRGFEFSWVFAYACELLSSGAAAAGRLQEQLQEAHSLMQLADQLREAIKGDNETVLETLLREAEKLDISGLHTAQSRCEQLRSMRSDLQRSLTAAVAELDVAAFETLEARCGQLPAEEVEQFRQDLVLSIAEEEKQLQEVINSSDPSEESLGAALTKCRLSSQNSWRRLAESSLTALQAINRIRSTLACVPVDEMGLQARLSSGSFAAKELQKLSAEAQKLSEGWLSCKFRESSAARKIIESRAAKEQSRFVIGPKLSSIHTQSTCNAVMPCTRRSLAGAQIKATLFSTLQTALDEGYVGLAGAQADQALETLLSAKIWKDGHWKSIQPSDLRELEIRAEEATKAGRDRLAEPLQTALEVGQCSVELAAAMRENDAEKLEACLEKARQLGFNRLEEVQRRLQNMRFSMEGRRGLRRPVRNAESPALLLPSAPAEQNPPFEEENARKTWPSPAEKSEHNGQDKQDQLMRYEAHDQQVRCTNLIFIDLETTSGFYDFEEMPQILEVAIIITDRHLNELDRGHWVVGGFSRKELESLGEFHKANFRDSEPGGNFPPLMGYGGGNGLFSDILASVLSTEQVENQIMQIVVQHCPPGECPLVGYSVQCDREVIKDKMPRLYRHLSHQIVDVSSFFIVSRLWLPEHWQYWDRRSETYNHRAVNDVEDAIEALRWVREKFFSESLLPFGAAKETLPTAASLL